MKKNILCLAVVLCVLPALAAGCGSAPDGGVPAESSADGESADAVDLEAMREAMLAADTTLPGMAVATGGDENAELNFGSFSDFDYSRVRDYFYAYAMDGRAEEIAVIELNDQGDAAALMATLKEHLEDRRGALLEYSPDQVSLIDHAVLKQKGSCVAMIVSQKSGLVQKAFEGAA